MPYKYRDRRAEAKEYYKRNREKVLARNKARYWGQTEHVKDISTKSYGRHREMILAKQKASYPLHREKRLARGKEYRENNKEKIAKYNREYRSTHREQGNAYAKEWQRKRYKSHPEKYRQYNQTAKQSERYKLWLERNRERINESNRERAKKNPAARKAVAKRYYDSHREKVSAAGRAFRKKRPDLIRFYASQRRALRKSVTCGNLNQLKALYKWAASTRKFICHWCEKRVPKGERHLDHYVPISKGGTHSVDNLVPACKRCNLCKHDTLPHEFKPPIASQQLRLGFAA